jgi:hypothetical protein
MRVVDEPCKVNGVERSAEDPQPRPTGPTVESFEVKSPGVTHTISVRKLEDWLNGTAKAPTLSLDRHGYQD